MTIVLFGEGMGGEFERGVGQYPTVGDEVHLVTNEDLKVIYGWSKGKRERYPSVKLPLPPAYPPISVWLV